MKLANCISLQAHSKDSPIANSSVVRHGLHITVEAPKGTNRILHNAEGKPVYKKLMMHDYGYFNGTKGRDGDEVDCMIGPFKDAKEVFVVHMKDNGPDAAEREDEDKCMIGFQSADAAKAAFLSCYPPDFYDGMTALPVDQFKDRMAKATLPYRKKKITATSIGVVGDPGVAEHLYSMPVDPDSLAGRKSVRLLPRRDVSVKKDVPENAYRSAADILRRMVKAASSKCPKCGGRKIVLMPTIYRAKCKDCGKTWQAKRVRADSGFPNQPAALPPVG